MIAAAMTLTAPAMAATTLNAGLSGTIDTNQLFPVPGEQTFTLTGNFTSYVASPDLPQVSGGDIAQYSFTVSGVSSGFDTATNTATYSLTSGTINAYGFLIQTLAPTTLTVQFSPDGSVGTVLGTLVSAGPTPRPPGFPGSGDIDFTPANGAIISGTYTRTGPDADGLFNGSIVLAAVPEPASWAMMIAGFGLIGGTMRRTRTTRIRYATA